MGKELWWFGRGNGLALCVHVVGIVRLGVRESGACFPEIGWFVAMFFAALCFPSAIQETA